MMQLPEERKTQLPDLDTFLSELGDNPVETLSQTFAGSGPKTRAIIGAGELERATPEAPPDDTSVEVAEAGVRAARKVQDEGPNAELTPEEVLGLEAIIITEGRPPILIQDGKFFPPPTPWAHLEQHRPSIESTFRSVGRVEATSLFPFVGTGFLVADDVVMTNRHVAEKFSSQGVGGEWSFKPGMTAHIDYAEELGALNSAEFAFTEVIGIHPTLDLALFRVENTSPGGATAPEPLTIASTPPAVTNEVFVVGYPAADPDEPDPPLMRQLFSNVYNVKRLQPGVITRLIDVKKQLLHDCSTLGGNSGSCVIDLQMNQVVGLHFAGLYREANYAVALWQLTDDPLLTSAGVNFE